MADRMESNGGAALLRCRSRMAAPSALAAVCATVAAWNVAIDTPSADAQTGRRLCYYLSDQPGTETYSAENNGVFSGGAVDSRYWVAMNYTKNEGCPQIEDTESFAKNYSGLAPASAGIPQEVCEDWQEKTGANGAYHAPPDYQAPLGVPGDDLCEVMEKDTLYTISVYQQDENVVKKGDYKIIAGSHFDDYSRR